ncbi:MAG: bifunctional oligoribonuclease/PAP phosphatase NrnA [Blautia sp.]|uniref:DHH family phosphoesterase n=1 Tax=Blautia sp. TaxID=1955243 RepID=UPI002E7599D8|nr:bifunctional oligoribonuclease/PAP phosphatase NrnA [Blautia sp.]MEE1442240.1 bifunctional oligoribonuclease/PAP phosphatase NrnA [Blautia sp.]
MEKIANELAEVNTVAIAGHVRPDGDCVGSCMGLYLYLKENYPEIATDVYLELPGEQFSFLSCFEEIKTAYEPGKVYDLLITLDVSDKNRIGVALEGYETAKKRVCIDHHISNRGLGDVNEIRPNASSTCEVLYTLLEEEKVSKVVAEALYTGMVHDTGVFQYSCTSPETMRIAAKLMEKDIPFTKIVEESFYEKTYVQNQILGRCLMESILIMDGKCVIGVVKKKMMDFYHVEPKDLDGIVQQLRVIKGVEVAIFIYEVKPQEFKVSLRSKGKVNVNEVASYFGGGGHVLAAGCTFHGSVYDVMNNLLEIIEKQLPKE